MPGDLAELARLAVGAADRARAEIMPRFRGVAVSTKADGSPVTEADRAAERAMRAWIRAEDPGAGILGEEYGVEGATSARRLWVLDPIDGTIAFVRGIPLFATIVAVVEDGEPVVGLIDLPMLDERTLGWRGGGCRRNGVPVRVSTETDLRRALVSHGDPFCFERAGQRAAFERMAREIPMLRGYTDAFGHAQVIAGGVDAMVDLDLNPWDAAATRVLVPEAGGRCVVVPSRPSARGASGEPAHAAGSPPKSGLVFGAPAVVDALLAFLAP